MPEPDYNPDDSNVETFQEAFERAQADRLAGNLDKAESTYRAMMESNDPHRRGIGHHHYAICQQNRAWGAEGLARDEYFSHALEHSNKGMEEYEVTGNFVEASDCLLLCSAVYRDRGDVEATLELVRGSIAYQERHRADGDVDDGDADDQDFFDSHWALKHARLAAALLRAGEAEEARQTIDSALGMPQQNEYFRMVTEQIAGDVYQAAGDTEAARAHYEPALEKAHQHNETRRIKELKLTLETLG